MDEQLLVSAVRELAAPVEPPADALVRVHRAVEVDSRRRLVGRAVLAVMIVVVVAASAALISQRTSTPPTDGGSMRLGVALNPSGGIDVSTILTYPDNRSLLSGYYLVDGQKFDVETFYNNSLPDIDPMPSPMPVEPGDVIDVDAKVFPDCAADSGEPPTLVITSKLAEGSTTTEQISTANPHAYRAAAVKTCAHAVQGKVYGVTRSPEGHVIALTVRLSNSTSQPVDVTSQPLVHGDSVWPKTSVTVPARGEVELELAVDGPGGGGTPCSDDLVQANGVAIYSPNNSCGTP